MDNGVLLTLGWMQGPSSRFGGIGGHQLGYLSGGNLRLLVADLVLTRVPPCSMLGPRRRLVAKLPTFARTLISLVSLMLFQ